MTNNKQIQVNFLKDHIHSCAKKNCEFTLPNKAKVLDSAKIQKQDICILQGKKSLKLNVNLNLRLVYVEQETLAFREYDLAFSSSVLEQYIAQKDESHFETSLAPDSKIKFLLTAQNLVTLQAELHIVTQVFAKKLLFLDELKLIDGNNQIITTKEGYTIPGVGTISVSLES